MTSPRPVAIEVEHLRHAFRSPRGERVPALADVSLTVHEGEFVSVVGPSGCGKSTLLRVLADLLEPSAGRVRVRGKPPRQARLDRDYGFVFQRPVLFEWRSALSNVLLPLEVAGGGGAGGARRAASLLELVGLGAFAGYAPWQLSGGMQQRVAIARALAGQPAVLLLDEPLGQLDELTRAELNAELLRICEGTGVTTLLVTHSVLEAVLLSDRVLVMGAPPGRIVGVVRVELPRPRSAATQESAAYFQSVTAVRRVLRQGIGRG